MMDALTTRTQRVVSRVHHGRTTKDSFGLQVAGNLEKKREAAAQNGSFQGWRQTDGVRGTNISINIPAIRSFVILPSRPGQHGASRHGEEAEDGGDEEEKEAGSEG
jgi:hypothetical protein